MSGSVDNLVDWWDFYAAMFAKQPEGGRDVWEAELRTIRGLKPQETLDAVRELAAEYSKGGEFRSRPGLADVRNRVYARRHRKVAKSVGSDGVSDEQISRYVDTIDAEQDQAVRWDMICEAPDVLGVPMSSKNYTATCHRVERVVMRRNIVYNKLFAEQFSLKDADFRQAHAVGDDGLCPKERVFLWRAKMLRENGMDAQALKAEVSARREREAYLVAKRQCGGGAMSTGMSGMRPLSADEVGLLMAALPEKYLCWFLVALCTGFRVSELLSLTRGDVLDADGEVVRVLRVERRNMKGKVRSRSIELTPPARSAIEGRIEQMNREGLVLLDHFLLHRRGHGDQAVARETVYRMFRRTCTRLDIHGALGTHSTRKTFAGLTHDYFIRKVQAGDVIDPILHTSKLMGHASVASTQSYLSFKDDELSAAVCAVGNWGPFKTVTF